MATISEIAAQAGVSASTVSYVLSGKRQISQETRDKVQAVIADLGYRPHAAARALRSRTSRTVALSMPALDGNLMQLQFEFLPNVAAPVSERGYRLLLSCSPREQDEVETLLGEGSVDGMLVMEVALEDERVRLLRESGTPFVAIGHTEREAGVSYVDFDFDQAARRAVAHLAQLGHRSIAFVNKSERLLKGGYGPAVRCAAGFDAALAEHELDGVAVTCQPTPADGRAMMETLLDAHPDLTAAVSVNEDVLGGMLDALRQAGRGVPDDFSLVGIGPPSVATSVTPHLSMLEMPVAEMGHTSAELLLDILEGKAHSRRGILLDADITVRDSSGPRAR